MTTVFLPEGLYQCKELPITDKKVDFKVIPTSAWDTSSVLARIFLKTKYIEMTKLSLKPI